MFKKRFSNNNNNNNIFDIIIYSIPKTGSQTLFFSFLKNNYKTYHIHDKDYKYQAFRRFKNQDIFEIINKSSKNKKLYIIESYRLPIERLISCFFQISADFILSKYSMQDLNDFFNNNFIEKHWIEGSSNQVFEHYNFPKFNSFDFDNKFNIYTNKNINLIKIRFKDIKDWSNILSQVLKKEIIISENNITENKVISNIYNDFKKQYKLPKKYLDKIKNDLEFKIYNTENEQREYLEYWDNNSI